MDVFAILKLIQTGITLTESIVGIVTKAKTELGSEDQAELDQALAAYKARNEELFTLVDAKLTEAGKNK